MNQSIKVKWESPRKRELDNHIYTDLVRARFSEKLKKALKRIMDIVGSLLGFVLAMPLMIIIALAIILTSEGSIIYRQKRIGYLGKPFELLKFRTMICRSDNGIHQSYIKNLISNDNKAGENDRYRDRIQNDVTYVGKLLRKTSVDELPQLINILRGDMSIVGPRPHPWYEVENYKAWHNHRLEVKPGLTGLSKILIRDSADNYRKAMRLDIWYLKNWSILLDLEIFCKTFYHVIRGRGAD